MPPIENPPRRDLNRASRKVRPCARDIPTDSSRSGYDAARSRCERNNASVRGGVFIVPDDSGPRVCPSPVRGTASLFGRVKNTGTTPELVRPVPG